MAEEVKEDIQFYKITTDTPITKYIRSGQVIEIEIKLGLFAGQYRSRILDFGSKYIKLMVPKVNNKEQLFWKATTLHINYMRPDAMFTFKSKIKKSELDPRPSLLIAIPEQVERVQRRRYVRVDTPGMTINFRKFNEDIPLMENDDPFTTSKLFNISAGGMRIDSDDLKIEKGEIVELEFTISNFKCQHVLGEVVRSLELTKKDRNNNESIFYSHGINFLQIHRVQKEKIFSYVFKREREMISGGVK